MHTFNEHGGGWMMVFWWIIILIPFLAVVWWMISSSRSRKETKSEDPMRVLKERYAKGEIDKEEFEEKRKTLLG